MNPFRRETADDESGTPGLVTVMTWSLGWCFIARAHPWGGPTISADPLAVSADPFAVWLTAVQCVSLQCVALAVWLGWRRMRPGTSAWFGRAILAAWPAIFCVDLWIYSLTGVHVASARFVELLRDVPISIITFASSGVAVSLIGLATAWSVVFVLVGGAETFVRRSVPILHSRSRRWERVVAITGMIACLVFGLSQRWVLSRFPDRAELIREHSTRHPMAMLGWLNEPPAQILVKRSGEIERIAAELPGIADRRIRQLRMNVVVEQGTRQADILIVVGESLRPELLTPDVMPNTFALTRRGLWLRQHYAGGNASSLGVFSIVSGLEAVWFYKSGVRFAPTMNRLFRQVGYELGFFASANDWSTFQMDAFLSDEHYDAFQCERFSGLESDRRAIAATEAYLDSDPTRPPRLAMLYLYGTHAPFWCEEAESLDAPAADDSYPIPFPQSWRRRVWNRYRNAARTLDASIGDLIRQPERTEDADRPRIVIVTGDHGESFGDDGTIGHGTKLSVDQTRTLAVIAGSGLPQRQVDQTTAHFDLLPTMLSAAGITTSLPDQLDGRDLTQTTPWAPRTFSIAGYVGKEIAIVDDRKPAGIAEPWAMRCRFSLMDGSVELIEPIGPGGRRWKPHEVIGDGSLADWLGRLPR
ncbi:sulfatase-like hydrolase/transferase [Neorhodopirellula pilleata]|uniref:Sulfatase n=1 Tax=Neorhodopirellula pilleata TaxID=2714738 RepID=A0A5C6AV74_9BACT|nr:sulfatase-like hydrolase/transferase [Neorhodopirellula pilleata]TWU03109.1 Sulfatase [Neorhodopirellula pilleata]